MNKYGGPPGKFAPRGGGGGYFGGGPPPRPHMDQSGYGGEGYDNYQSNYYGGGPRFYPNYRYNPRMENPHYQGYSKAEFKNFSHAVF